MTDRTYFNRDVRWVVRLQDRLGTAYVAHQELTQITHKPQFAVAFGSLEDAETLMISARSVFEGRWDVVARVKAGRSDHAVAA